MIYEALAQVLNEFFVDVREQNVSFYHGDLFEPSHFRLSDLFLKTSLVNSLHLPFELAAGYLRDFKIEGLLGVVAGSPLTLSADHICLVLRPKGEQWGDELLLRYAKELVVALWQSFLTPSVGKKGSASSISPAKWISGRIQAAGADMSVQFKHIHIRVEGEHNGTPMAYGLHIPLVRFASREVEEQILHRRQQPGIKYPSASEHTTSKLLTLENLLLYCDLSAEPYWIPPTKDEDGDANISADANEASLNDSEHPSGPPKSLVKALEKFRAHALKPLARDQRREVLFVRVVWIKIDLQRTLEKLPGGSESPGRLAVAAIDVVTEEIEFNLDFTQISALHDELERVRAFLKRMQMLQRRPSCMDRQRLAPPTVRVSASALLPLVPDSDVERETLVLSADKQRKSKHWFRAMWRYAIHCVMEQRRQDSKDLRDNVLFPSKHQGQNLQVDDEDVRRNRYIHLYTRNLSSEALEIVLRGRIASLVAQAMHLLKSGAMSEGSRQQSPPPSPRRFTLPAFEPLSLKERWEFSDLVLALPVYQQRMYRAVAESELRKLFASTPPSPTRTLSSASEFPVTPAQAVMPRRPAHTRSLSMDNCSTSPTAFSPPSSTNLPPDFMRSTTMGASVLSNALRQQQSIRQASPPQSQAQVVSAGGLPTGTKRIGEDERGQLPMWGKKKDKLSSPSFEQACFPAFLLNPSRCIPLVNWNMGPLTVRICPVDQSISREDAAANREVVAKWVIESCNGAILLGRKPTLSFLVEVRLGLIRAVLVSQLHYQPGQTTPTNHPVRGDIHEYTWLSSDYIRTPADGFFYAGMKYASPTGVLSKPTEGQRSEDSCDLKGRVCIGSLRIDFDDVKLRAALGETATAEFRALQAVATAQPTHLSVLCQAYRSCLALISHLSRKKRRPVSRYAAPMNEDEDDHVKSPLYRSKATEQQRIKKKVRKIQLLQALLLRSSTFELDVGDLELNLSAPTSHVTQAMSTLAMEEANPEVQLADPQTVRVTLPAATFQLENRPAMNECVVKAAGAHVFYQTSEQGRAAVVQRLLQHLGS